MRKLKLEEIKTFANRPNVNKETVTNFLNGMDTDLHEAIEDFGISAKSYGWDKQTMQAILDGIWLAEGLWHSDKLD